MIEAVIVDSREPDSIQSLSFSGVPKAVMMLEAGDLRAVCSDGCVLLVERKTPDDLLNTLRDDRLFPQMAHLVQARLDEQANTLTPMTWPYLVITGVLRLGVDGKVITSERGLTGWNWDTVQGALLTVQEMGVFVEFCDEGDYEGAVMRLGKRQRGEIKLLPPRYPNILCPQAAVLASLPGIGIENSMRILDWAGGHLGYAISGLTDLTVQEAPVGIKTRRKIRDVLGLKNSEELCVIMKNDPIQQADFMVQGE